MKHAPRNQELTLDAIRQEVRNEMRQELRVFAGGEFTSALETLRAEVVTEFNKVRVAEVIDHRAHQHFADFPLDEQGGHADTRDSRSSRGSQVGINQDVIQTRRGSIGGSFRDDTSHEWAHRHFRLSRSKTFNKSWGESNGKMFSSASTSSERASLYEEKRRGRRSAMESTHSSQESWQHQQVIDENGREETFIEESQETGRELTGDDPEYISMVPSQGLETMDDDGFGPRVLMRKLGQPGHRGSARGSVASIPEKGDEGMHGSGEHPGFDPLGGAMNMASPFLWVSEASGEPDRGPSRMSGLRTVTLRWVKDPIFDITFGLFVSLSAVVLGFETDWEATHPGTKVPAFYQLSNALFAFVFAVEIGLRLFAERRAFFSGSRCAWNVFDLLLAVMQIFEQAWHVFLWSTHTESFDTQWLRYMRMIRTGGRLLRLVRILRLMRLLHELRMLCTSIIMSMKSLCWTLALLCVLVFSVSIFFTEAVALTAQDQDKDLESELWFGSVPRSSLTLFECILGGISWDEVVRPLISEVSPLVGATFCLYVAFCALAVLNVVTGIFVGKAAKAAEDEKDETLAFSIGDLFYSDTDKESHITFKEFSSKLEHTDMQEYFRDLNVDVSEARGLFRLLDVDGSGSVDSDEIVSGCLRLRGEAKAIELALLMQETRTLQDMVERLASGQLAVERNLSVLSSSLFSKARGHCSVETSDLRLSSLSEVAMAARI